MMGICGRCPRPPLRLAPTLRVAKFRNCHFPPLNDAPALILPRLKHLELVAVCLSKGDMECLLCGCTALEYLLLQVINGFSTFHITSMTLRTIYVCCWCGRKTSQKVDHGMVIQDTPALERLLVVDQEGPTRINVISAPKLTMVGYSSDKTPNLLLDPHPFRYNNRLLPLLLQINIISNFEDVCSSVIQKMIPTSLTPKLRTVKVLALESIGPDLEQVVSFLRCSPCLEKLYIEVMFLSC